MATAVGLIVAIPAVIGYNHIMARIDRVIQEMSGFSADILNIMEKQAVKKTWRGRRMALGTERPGKRGRYMSQINVTPFVDVMLVLLIIFMVTAP